MTKGMWIEIVEKMNEENMINEIVNNGEKYFGTLENAFEYFGFEA